MKQINLLTLYKQLFKHFGPQYWWPVLDRKENREKRTETCDPRFEICVGAILTQNTNWTNVEKALENLHSRKLLSPQAALNAPLSQLRSAIRPAGYYNQKAKKLRLFTEFIYDCGGLDQLFQLPIGHLREALLSVWGIGRETADSIILYAAKKPIFVIDTYTKRLLDLCNIRFEDYDEYRNFFETQLPRRVGLWNEYHALIVQWGKLNTQNPNKAKEIIGIRRKEKALEKTRDAR